MYPWLNVVASIGLSPGRKDLWVFSGLDLSGAAQQVRNPPALGELIGLSVYGSKQHSQFF